MRRDENDQPMEANGRWSYRGAIHDASRWPLVVMRLPADGSDEEWAVFLERVHLCFDDAWREKSHYIGEFCTILDISEVTNNDARRRKDWDQMLERYATELHRDSLGSAVVLSSAIGRFIFTAVTWLEAARGGKRPPTEVFSTYAEAEAWCVEKLAAAGLKPAPAA